MTPVDSRDYRFPFEVPSIRDAPADFLLSESVTDLIGGLFLPRYVSEWFGQSTPPRLLLLSSSSLTIISHPQSESPIMTVSLAELTAIESGRTILIGWVRFMFGSSSATLPYNTRCQWPVERFMGLLRALIFSPCAAGPLVEERFGALPDIKFKNARGNELDARENVRTSFFEPPTELPRRFGWLSFRRWSPGDFLALTDRRMLWITDRIHNRHDPYGVVSRYVRGASVSDIVFDTTRSELIVSFGADASWRIPVRPEYGKDARSFAETNVTRPAS
jgi:hypothetical protein